MHQNSMELVGNSLDLHKINSHDFGVLECSAKVDCCWA